MLSPRIRSVLQLLITDSEDYYILTLGQEKALLFHIIINFDKAAFCALKSINFISHFFLFIKRSKTEMGCKLLAGWAYV